MKILQTPLSHLAMTGIRLKQSLINKNFFVTDFIIVKTAIQCWLFLIFECNNFREYINSIFLTSTFTMAAVCFTILATEKRLISTMLGLTLEIIEKSK